MRSLSRPLSLLTAALAVFAAAHTARADSATLVGLQDTSPGVFSGFTLDFGTGTPETALVSDTVFTLAVDDAPAPTGTATFLSYSQNVASLNMPNPLFGQPGQPQFLPTGPISVSIVPGTSGASSYLFDGGTTPPSAVFSTTEDYLISWTGDLTLLGLGGPNGGSIVFPSTSVGTIAYQTSVSGTIHQEWSGTFTGLGFPIDYTCVVNTVFTPEPASLGLLFVAALALRRRRTA